MAFQFLCPHGHLLQGEESQSGQQCKCPYCEALFFVPNPPVTARGDRAEDTSLVGEGPYRLEESDPAPAEPIFEDEAPSAPTPYDEGTDNTARDAESPAPVFPADQEAQTERSVLHIPCPSGHVLETPQEMMGQLVMCPFCQQQFRLRAQDSQEYKQKKAKEREEHEERVSQLWLNWSIIAAVVVVIAVVVLILLATAR